MKNLSAICNKNLNFFKCAVVALFVMISTGGAMAAQQPTNIVSMKKGTSSLIEVMNQVEQQTDYLFVYNQSDVNVDKKINVEKTKMNVADILELIQNNGIAYQMSDKYITLTKAESAKTAQNDRKITIKGKITTSKGETAIGATVMEKGSKSNGTVTDIDGNYTLTVAENAMIEVSSLGYITVTVPAKSNLNVVIKEDVNSLDGVVFIGYGTEKRGNLTGAVASINYDDELTNRPITNASQALAGKASGVWVSQNSGTPGADEAQLRVRGWGTLGNSNPLVLIDGVEGSMGQVNPNDIKSITVLKDAANAAIYGSKAANGVVLITTKTGSANQKLSISLNSFAGFQQLDRHYDLVNNSVENMKMSNIARQNDGKSPLYPEETILAFENNDDPYLYPNTDWYKVVFRNAFITTHNVSVSGGTDKLAAYTSVNYSDQDGILLKTNAQKFGFRTNLSYKVNNWLKVGGRLNYNKTTAKEPYSTHTVYWNMCNAMPYTAPRTKDGQLGAVQAFDEVGAPLNVFSSPLAQIENGQQKTIKNYITINAFSDINLMKDLMLKLDYTTYASFNNVDSFNEDVWGHDSQGRQYYPVSMNKDGICVSRSYSNSFRNIFHATLNYDKTIGKHSFGGILGTQFEDFVNKTVSARKSNPPKPGMTEVDAGTDRDVAHGNSSLLRMVSYFGRLNYSFADRYLLELNMRADASSRFRRGHRWGFFPGVSAGWRMSEEDFIKDLGVFSNLKLRASWGELGNQDVNGYWPYLATISQGNGYSYNYGETFAPGAAIKAIVDEDITWETTATLDFGLDMAFFDNKLSFEMDYFDKTTRGILVQLPITHLLGSKTAPYQNVGKMNNKGFELTVNYDNQVYNRDQFGYNLGFNMTYVDNKVTKFQGGNSPDQFFLIREGYSYKEMYAWKAIGIYQSDEEAAEHMVNNSYIPKQGNIKYEDVNGDGKMDSEDYQAVGNTIPKLTYGFNANFRYKGFDLNFLFQGMGMSHVNIHEGMTEMDSANRTICTFWKESWTPENKDSNIPMLRYDNTWDTKNSSFWIRNNSFLKLKNVQLGYEMPQCLVKKANLSKVYFYANVQNAHTFLMHKGYEGYDPERNNTGSDSWYYPTSRTFTFGVNINF